MEFPCKVCVGNHRSRVKSAKVTRNHHPPLLNLENSFFFFEFGTAEISKEQQVDIENEISFSACAHSR